MNTDWIELFEEFFKSRSDAIGEIFDATYCRENWLHGELFRWFRFRRSYSTFKVDSLPLSNSHKADFSAEEPTPLVGEIKLLGWDYQPKVITGGSIQPVFERLDKPITAEDRNLDIGSWGLIHDFFQID